MTDRQRTRMALKHLRLTEGDIWFLAEHVLDTYVGAAEEEESVMLDLIEQSTTALTVDGGYESLASTVGARQRTEGLQTRLRSIVESL